MKRIEMLRRMPIPSVAIMLVTCINPDEKYGDYIYITPKGDKFYRKETAIKETEKWLNGDILTKESEEKW